MTRPRRIDLAAAALLACTAPAVAQAGLSDPHELVRLQRVVRAAVDHVAPSIVRVETFGGSRRMLAAGGPAGDGAAPPKPKRRPRPRPPEGGEKKGEGLGPLVMPGFLQAQGATSGIVLRSDGWILISRFAVNFDPTTILVTLADGRAFNATRHGEDTSRGIALVKIDATDLPVPEFVDPADVRVGQWAFALGRTFGNDEPSVHMGIVSATRRLFGRALQVDAYTSPANYGGPVIDVRGQVLGVAVPLSPSGRDAGVDWYDSGIGFATTIGDIHDVIARLQDGDVLHRGHLGIRFDPSDTGPGVSIAHVGDDTPAHAAGLEEGGRILALDDVPVKNSFHLQMLVASRMAGDEITVTFRNPDDESTRATVVLEALPEVERGEQSKSEESFVPPWHGDAPSEDEGR